MVSRHSGRPELRVVLVFSYPDNQPFLRGENLMTYSKSLPQRRRFWAKASAIAAVTLLVASASAAQATRPAPPPPNAPWLQELNKNPILQAELGKFVVRL